MQNRNSKLNKAKHKENEIDEESIDSQQFAIDFYKKPEETKKEVNKNDYNLGKNTKMVLDFSEN